MDILLLDALADLKHWIVQFELERLDSETISFCFIFLKNYVVYRNLETVPLSRPTYPSVWWTSHYILLPLIKIYVNIYKWM